LTDEVCRAIEEGCDMYTAFKVQGVSRRCVDRWRAWAKKHPRSVYAIFCRRTLKAMAVRIQKGERAVMSGINGVTRKRTVTTTKPDGSVEVRTEEWTEFFPGIALEWLARVNHKRYGRKDVIRAIVQNAADNSELRSPAAIAASIDASIGGDSRLALPGNGKHKGNGDIH
jgi:hypothetical protein